MLISVRTNIQEGHIDYAVTAQSWPAFSYMGFSCHVNDIEQGFFRSPLLVKVSHIRPSPKYS